jgi:hypothetical protein
VVVVEMMNFDRKAIANRLKAYQSRNPDVVRINRKNVQQYTIPNLVHFVFLSNHRNAMALDDDDRRNLVYWSPYVKPEAGTKERAAEDEEFKELHAWLGDGDNGDGCAFVVHWLLKRDVRNFNPGAHAPFTEAKREMIRETRSEVERWMIEAIEDGAFDTDLVTVLMVQDYVAAHARRLADKATDQAVRSALRHVAAKPLPQIDLNTGNEEKRGPGEGRRKRKWVRPWALRNAKKYLAMSRDALCAAWQQQRPDDAHDEVAAAAADLI